MNRCSYFLLLFTMLVSVCSVTPVLADVSSSNAGFEWRDSPELTAIFASAHVTGTFVLYNASTGVFVGHNKARAETRFIPASTFKIPNALIGLAAGSVTDVDMVLPYGGKPQPVKDWERDMSLREAMPISNVPIYQELARRTGLAAMRFHLALWHYGNQDPGDDGIDTFWLRGPLQISAVEQTLFLARLAQSGLPLAEIIQATAREIILLEQGEGWTLYGKTGSAMCYSSPLGWWVGWVEKFGTPYVFALNIDMPGADDARKRVEIGKACLKILGIL